MAPSSTPRGYLGETETDRLTDRQTDRLTDRQTEGGETETDGRADTQRRTQPHGDAARTDDRRRGKSEGVVGGGMAEQEGGGAGGAATLGEIVSVGEYAARRLLAAAGGEGSEEHSAAIRNCALHYLHADGKFVQLAAELFVMCGGSVPDSEATTHAAEEEFVQQLTAELEQCFAEYFREHWDDPDGLLQANKLLDGAEPAAEPDEALTPTTSLWAKLHKLEHRQFVAKSLHAKREFLTLGEILRETAPETRDPARRPTARLLGGGMAAGKSTVVGMLKENWKDSVVIEADAFKMHDPIFDQLNKDEHGANEVGMVVHSHSTDAANEELLAALLNQRDIVMDGTMTWKPFVEQTIDMIRHVHEREYKLGPGWQPATKTEQYWVDVGPRTVDEGAPAPLPYKIEMIGVTVDPSLAVGRGLRRKMMTGRGVPVSPQLRSHRLYSEHFEAYLPLLDEASLYDTSVGFGKAKLVATYSKMFGESLLVDEGGASWSSFKRKAFIEDKARGAFEMYSDGPFVADSVPVGAEITARLAGLVNGE
eukprot:COSAG02_NODE_5350_length_4408_cov_48.603852_3_plen_537_part_00